MIAVQKKLSLADLATLTGAVLVEASSESSKKLTCTEDQATASRLEDKLADCSIRFVAPIDRAGPGALSFLVGGKLAQHLTSTNAMAIFVDRARTNCSATQLVVKDPYLAFAKATSALFPKIESSGEIHSSAVVDPTAELGTNVSIGPQVTIGPRVVLGRDVIVGAGSVVNADVSIGPGSELRANCVIEAGCVVGADVLIHGGTVIGADGFGFAPGPSGLQKIPQVAKVRIEDSVEIGALCTIDRGALQDTIIGQGSKLDSHVHVGHGATIGPHCVLCSMVAIAGSATLGARVVIAGHSAVNNKVEVPPGTQLGAMSAFISTPKEASGTFMGFPAQPAGSWRRQMALLKRLPELARSIKQLSKTANDRDE